MPGPAAVAVVLPLPLAGELARLATSRTAPVRLVERAKIVVLAAEGWTNAAIAHAVGRTVDTVRKWRSRFCTARGAESLLDQERSGRPATVRAEDRAALIKLACNRPDENLFQDVWTYPTIREALLNETGCALSESEVGRILRAEHIRPHKIRQWLHSPDPGFAPKVERICGLYLDPPADATVLCVDEKPGMQALERKYPSRQPGPGQSGRREFEYIRHGTQTLIGALDVKTGKVFGHVGATRTADDLIAFMEEVARRYPTGDVYIIWDNLNIHNGGKDDRWVRFNIKHGNRFKFVYTPIHASWVNQIEIWFSILQRRILRNSSFRSVEELALRVRGFIARWNTAEARPIRWKFRGRFTPRGAPTAVAA